MLVLYSSCIVRFVLRLRVLLYLRKSKMEGAGNFRQDFGRMLYMFIAVTAPRPP